MRGTTRGFIPPFVLFWGSQGRRFSPRGGEEEKREMGEGGEEQVERITPCICFFLSFCALRFLALYHLHSFPLSSGVKYSCSFVYNPTITHLQIQAQPPRG